MGNPYISLLKTTWHYARQEKKKYLLIYSLFAIANVLVAMNPLLYGWFINGLQEKEVNALQLSLFFAMSYIGLKLLEWAFHGPARIMERELAFRIGKNFMEEHYHRILHLPIKWHQDNHTGSTISRVRKGYEALKDFFQNGFIYIYAFGKFFFSFAAMLYFSPLFGSIAVGLGILTTFIIIKFDKPYILSLKEMNEKEHKVSSTLFDSLSNIVTVITLRLEKRMEESVISKLMKVFPPFKRNVAVNEWKWFTAQMMVALIYGTIICGYVLQHWTPGAVFQIGGLVTLIGFVNQFTAVFTDIASQYTKVIQYNTDVQAAIQLGKEFESTEGKSEVAVLPAAWNKISISNLNFARNIKGEEQKYGDLSNLNIHIQRGKKVALIGESGSGKSTLLSLLRGLYVPENNNTIQVDNGIESDFAAIGNTVTLFPQEPEIFENSILYNITLGLPFTKEEVLEVCKLAQFTDVVKKLPYGLDTSIQEKGVNLSGGQKQRLALARGILAARASDIVLLDEPTSSVDPRTEKLIYLRLFQGFADKAVISSLHRLHLLPLFDYIYIMENGKIIDEGSFTELKTRSSIFQNLWQHQEEQLVELNIN